jgi:sigma-B regulation protein RsbU (phosphoserine phosphatase)
MARPRLGTLTAERRYELLLSLSGRIRATFDLDEILEHVLDAVYAVVPYDAAGVFVLNRAVPRELTPHPRQLIASIVQRGYDERLPETDAMLMGGHGLVGHVIRTGQSVDVSDVRQDPRYVEGRRGTLSEIAVPILGAREPIGALNLEADEPGAFDDEDLEILHVFADAASAAIGRALLHRELLERRRVEHQMQLAQEVQARLLPERAPRVPGYDIAGRCLPTFEIGGDYYDYLEISDEMVGLVIADVCGKGLAAALSMSAFRSVLRTQARGRQEPSHLANRLNVLMPDATAESAYVTCVYALLEPKDGCLRYTNCGHNPPLHLKSDGSVQLLDTGGFPLGIFSDSRYETGVATLEPGEVVLFYTDGVVECRDPRSEEFGIERLGAVLKRSRCLPVPELVDEIVRASRGHCATEAFPDDFTVMLVRRSPSGTMD